jgi:hypothetical protein
MTTISGAYDGEPITIEVQDDQIARPSTGSALLLAAKARGAVQAGLRVDVPGVWSGPASLSDPWALRALFIALLDAGTARFEGDAPPPLGENDPPGTVY